MEENSIRIDLHVHSKFSRRPSQWILQKIGCPESFTEPLDIYRIARMHTMNLVTITDHNRIEGALEIAHLPKTFVSEEITTYFPEDHCKIHVLALNITEKQHADIQKVRENIYDLVDYLIDSKIVHIVAHPLFSINDRLTAAHFEKLLLLFQIFELNGARNDGANECLQRVLSQLTPAIIDRLADEHDLKPRGYAPWRKSISGGSDDHSSLNIARTYTEIPGAESLVDALNGILNCRARIVRRPSTPLTFAHNIYAIAYQFYHNRFGLKKYTAKDMMLNFLDRSLRPQPDVEGPGFMAKIVHFLHYRRRLRFQAEIPESMAALVRHETGKILRDNPHLLAPCPAGSDRSGGPEKNWFDFVDGVSNRIMLNFARHLMDHLSGADVFNIFHTAGSAGGLYAMLAPYFLAFTYFSQDREFYTTVYRHFDVAAHDLESPRHGAQVVAHFVDHFFDPAQFAETLNRSLPALVYTRKNVEILTCGGPPCQDRRGIRFFEPVGTYEHADYPDQPLFFPPVLQMLHHCYAKNVNRICSAGPGPVGLAALAVARILKRPVYGTYHPSILPYAPFLAEDESIGDILEKFTRWYYDQLNGIYVFGASARDALLKQGVDPLKLIYVAPETDIRCFHPEKNDGDLKQRHGIHQRRTIVYAGRSSSGDHLHLLAQVFKILLRTVADTHLVLIEDGPEAAEMKRLLTGMPASVWTCETDEKLAAAFSVGEVAVFPDFKGRNRRRIIQAQAAGVPVVVSAPSVRPADRVPENTGLVVKGNDATGLFEAIVGLLGDPLNACKMGREARRYAEDVVTDVAPFAPSPLSDMIRSDGKAAYAEVG